VNRVIDMLGMRELALRRPTELSGGEQQKVIIARALAQEPRVLLLDEPTSDLDIKNQIEIMDLLKDVVKKEVISALIAMHDLNLASLYADRIIMLKEGRIVADGNTRILTPENIEKVYGINVSVLHHNGKTLILPETYAHKHRD
jgi:iron complex transport system ATP-binding protein